MTSYTRKKAPDWKIPPADVLCHRQTNSTQRVQRRSTSRALTAERERLEPFHPPYTLAGGFTGDGCAEVLVQQVQQLQLDGGMCGTAEAIKAERPRGKRQKIERSPSDDIEKKYSGDIRCYLRHALRPSTSPNSMVQRSRTSTLPQRQTNSSSSRPRLREQFGEDHSKTFTLSQSQDTPSYPEVTPRDVVTPSHLQAPPRDVDTPSYLQAPPRDVETPSVRSIKVTETFPEQSLRSTSEFPKRSHLVEVEVHSERPSHNENKSSASPTRHASAALDCSGLSSITPPGRPKTCPVSPGMYFTPGERDNMPSPPDQGQGRLVTSQSSGDTDDDYDTDCEPAVTPEFRGDEFRANQVQQEVDIGHLTYESVCRDHNLRPRRLVLKQLWETHLDLRHGGLSTLEVKAISSALCLNNRVEHLDLSHSQLDGQSLVYIFDVLCQNINITKLDVSGSVMDTTASTSCCQMLSCNRWLLSLNLSECCIGDSDIATISQGIKENHGLQKLNLSRNQIGLSGGMLLGRALGENSTLKIVNLSWNHIRGGGAVGVCNSLQKNTSIADLDLSWNGLGFEGSLALGESLRSNKSLRRLNLGNNRINWDCAPYLSKSLSVNTSLEILELGQNPLSMEGCEEIITAITKPSSNVQFVSFAGIPINTKIALLATDITKLRQFSLEHGGILSTRDIIGIQRVRREDPFSLLIRYLTTMGIRVMDLFRMFDRDNNLSVSRQKFIQGLKRVRVPLDDDDILEVAKRFQLNKHGNISYQELATTVRNRIREERKEDRRQEFIQKKKREERRRILQSDNPLNTPSYYNYMPSLYSMYGARDRSSQRSLYSPIPGSFSRRGSIFTPLPSIKRNRNYSSVDALALGRNTPLTLVRQSALPYINKMISSGSSLKTDDPNEIINSTDKKFGSSYVSQIKWQQTAQELTKRRQHLL